MKKWWGSQRKNGSEVFRGKQIRWHRLQWSGSRMRYISKRSSTFRNTPCQYLVSLLCSYIYIGVRQFDGRSSLPSRNNICHVLLDNTTSSTVHYWDGMQNTQHFITLWYMVCLSEDVCFHDESRAIKPKSEMASMQIKINHHVKINEAATFCIEVPLEHDSFLDHQT